MSLCPYCDGEGENLDIARCTDCEGTGFVLEIEREESECHYCQGSGKDELDELGICKSCHGKGFQ
jgi:DnaJ-class molecular chaperone